MLIIYFIIGLVVGSFLNVCICRLPKDESIAYPPSHCPHCHTPLKAYHLVPVLSYLFLNRRCAYCRAPISWRYPVVELLCAGLFTLVGLLNLDIKLAMLGCVFMALLIISAFIDLENFVVLDEINILIFILGLGYNYLENAWYKPPVWYAILAAAAVMGLIYFASRGAMGSGDVFFAVAISPWLGFPYVLSTLLIAFTIGAIIAIILMALKIKKRGEAVPFIPFLVISAIANFFVGPQIISAYWNFFL